MREKVQSKLNDLTNIEVGELVSDDVIEIGTTYFGFSFQSSYYESDLNNKTTNRVSLIGFIVRKNDTTENTQSIVDNATQNIINKLRELNFKCSSEDITMENGIRKAKITGYVYYDEMNDKLIF